MATTKRKTSFGDKVLTVGFVTVYVVIVNVFDLYMAVKDLRKGLRSYSGE